MINSDWGHDDDCVPLKKKFEEQSKPQSHTKKIIQPLPRIDLAKMGYDEDLVYRPELVEYDREDASGLLGPVPN